MANMYIEQYLMSHKGKRQDYQRYIKFKSGRHFNTIGHCLKVWPNIKPWG